MAINTITRKAIWITSRVVAKAKHIYTKVVAPDPVTKILQDIPNALANTDLPGKVVVITGSSHGVGQVLAEAFAKAGSLVVVNGRNSKQVDATVASIQSAGGTATGVCVDIASESGASQLIDAAVRHYGRIDLLINNAAVLGPVGIQYPNIPEQEWSNVFDVNVNGAFYCAKLATQWMVEHQVAGRIIHVSSGAARTASPGISPYAASKAALEMMTRSMALELESSGVSITCVELGSLKTPMTRDFFSWEDYQTLPPPEIVVPFFIRVATEPGASVNGRIFAAWRFLQDPTAEMLLNGPLVNIERFSFSPILKDGVALDRFADDVVAIDRAENPFGMPDKVKAILNQTGQLFDFSRYPDENYSQLRKALSERLSLPEECFTFGNGSAELVERVIRTFTQAGDEVLSNEPTWFMFDRICQATGVINRKVPFVVTNNRFDHNLEQLAKEIRYSTRLIYLINPSNPMGCGIPKDSFLRFLQQVPPHIPVIVDEAYLEYSSVADTLRSHEIILNTDRLVIGLRTFSKFYGLAGLRIGYGFANQELMRLFNRLEPLFMMSALAEAAAVAALNDEDHARRTLENADNERARIANRLAERGLSCFPGEMNLMIVECPVAPERVYEAFDRQAILMPKGVWNEKFIMFPINTPQQNDRNLDILLNTP